MKYALLKRFTLCTAAIVAAASIVSTEASATENCKWYALTSAKQQKANEKKSCGFKGTHWTKNIKKHARFCEGQPPEVWKAMVEKRQKALAGCK
ncbi:MAG: hypothetical protein V3V97_14870 [Hyphomicrobiaceae bacterium]